MECKCDNLVLLNTLTNGYVLVCIDCWEDYDAVKFVSDRYKTTSEIATKLIIEYESFIRKQGGDMSFFNFMEITAKCK